MQQQRSFTFTSRAGRPAWAAKHRPELKAHGGGWAIWLSFAFWIAIAAAGPFMCGISTGAYQRGHRVGAGR